MSIRNLPGGKGRPAPKADNLTAIRVPTVWKMWEPPRVTNLWAFMACYRDSFTFFLTPWTTGRIHKLTVTYLVKKYPAFHGNRKFITMPTTARNWNLSCFIRVSRQTPSYYFRTHFNIILPSTLRSPNCSVNFRFSYKNSIRISPLFPPCKPSRLA
jgi:hypothetical protein